MLRCIEKVTSLTFSLKTGVLEQFPKLDKSDFLTTSRAERCETFDASNVGIGRFGRRRVGGTRQIDEGEMGFAHMSDVQVRVVQVRIGQARVVQVRAV